MYNIYKLLMLTHYLFTSYAYSAVDTIYKPIIITMLVAVGLIYFPYKILSFLDIFTFKVLTNYIHFFHKLVY